MERSYSVKELGAILMPLPGDMIIALHVMHAWCSTNSYLPSPGCIQSGELAIILQCFLAGNNVRLITLQSNAVRIYSCKLANLRKNWNIIKLI